MQNLKARTPAEYIASLPTDRQAAIAAIRKLVNKRLPKGYKEMMSFGHISWGIPLEEYPVTYNGYPLMYAALASQKNHMALYLMCCYGDNDLYNGLKAAYAKAGKKFDMGKSCLRFKKLEDVELEAVGKVIAAVPPKKYLAIYEKSHPREKAEKKKVVARRRAARAAGREKS